MQKNMDTTTLIVGGNFLGLYRDNGKQDGNYHIIMECMCAYIYICIYLAML